MKFGVVPLEEAEGAIVAHSVDLPDGRLRKGQFLEAGHIEALRAAGHAHVIVARLEPTDVHENKAAGRIAEALVPAPEAAGLRLTDPFTGRVNLVAVHPGVVVLDAEKITALNDIDPMITFATVPAFQQMSPGQMVGTVKIIAYAVPEEAVARAVSVARDAIRLAPVVLQTAALVITDIAGGPGEKGRDAIEGRLETLGIALSSVEMVPHEEVALAAAVERAEAELVLILTGSATSDPYDVAPEAVRRAGGHVARFGMPVDPGNLLFIGAQGGRPVIGLPGCARSPALNGADWVLSRVAAGLEVTGADIAGMGVGGLLKEIPTRPMPRAGRKKR